MKILEAKVVGFGNSDQETCQIPSIKTTNGQPQMLQDFNIRSYLAEVYISNISQGVSESNDINEAAEVFENSFRTILDKQAPMKSIQIRKNFFLFLANNTKDHSD